MIPQTRKALGGKFLIVSIGRTRRRRVAKNRKTKKKKKGWEDEAITTASQAGRYVLLGMQRAGRGGVLWQMGGA